jgi:EmrB/QacA subfamily drug resistance transporter
MIVPVVQTMLARSAPPNLVAKAMGLISIPLVVGPVVGPVLGGLFVDDVSWRWMFFVNIPIGVVAVILALLAVPVDRPAGASERKLDVLGLVLLSPGFAALVYAFTTAGQHGHFADARVLIPAAVGVVLLVAYVLHALHTKSEPLIDVKLFRNRGFTLAAVVMFMIGGVANTLLFLTPLYYQQARVFDAVHAGLLLVPSGLVGALGSAMIGKLATKYTARLTTALGLLLVTLGMYVYTWVGPDTSQTLLAIALGVAGFGIGVAIPGTMAFMFSAVGPVAMPRAMGALFIFNQLGGSLGIALVAVTLQSNLTGTTNAPGAFGAVYWIIVAGAVAGVVAAAALPGSLKVAVPQAA